MWPCKRLNGVAPNSNSAIGKSNKVPATTPLLLLFLIYNAVPRNCFLYVLSEPRAVPCPTVTT